MAKVTVGIPKGTRDFGPETVRKRNYIFQTIRSIFELYGYQPLETPSMENLDTLMGKYGEEGDKLIFKILNNGLDNPKKTEKVKEGFEKILQGKNSTDITERALRYDLTIPFARYVAINHGQLAFPFKRYQMQPVWRADQPQRGRYREFYQCDADVVGSTSLLNEVELALIYAQVFAKLNIPVEIKINSRKILLALAESAGGGAAMTDIAIAIDKLDKIGLDKVKEELTQRGLNSEQVATIEKYLSLSGSNEEMLSGIENLLGKSATEGKNELQFVFENFQQLTANSKLAIDFTLARGLNYYTGIIFEVKATTVQMGSIGGGGRYDDLTGLFGVPNIPGVGISFGVDRIYDVMEELNLFPSDVHIGTQVLFFNPGDAQAKKSFELLQQLRGQGIRGEIYHESAKFDKQFKYAEKRNIPFIVIIGEEELSNGTCKLKDIRSGEQQTLSQDALLNTTFN